MEFEIGTKYHVLREGCSLSWTEIDGIDEFKVVTKELKVGDIIKYLGRKDFPGCDVSYDLFEIDKEEGIFWPNQFGGAKKEYLKKVT
ncbi:MAG: hypothetical protein GYA51_16390 [Candidatus Methanofastidiosa archaeon]|nr:hypothetical protein [Candidatus Methanofastidiosa archaeon]